MMAYTLSIRPVVRLAHDGYLPWTLLYAYEPLGWVYDRCPPSIQQIASSYQEFWGYGP